MVPSSNPDLVIETITMSLDSPADRRFATFVEHQQQNETVTASGPQVSQHAAGPQAFGIGTPLDTTVPNTPPGFRGRSREPQGSATPYDQIFEMMDRMRAELRAEAETAERSRRQFLIEMAAMRADMLEQAVATEAAIRKAQSAPPASSAQWAQQNAGATASPDATAAQVRVDPLLKEVPWFHPARAGVSEPGSFNSGLFPADAVEMELKDIDKKDVTPPAKYRGDASSWRHWYTKLVTFLSRRDARWGTLLETIRQRSTNPYTEEDVKEIFVLIGVRSMDLMARFKAQLYEYLETYTKG